MFPSTGIGGDQGKGGWLDNLFSTTDNSGNTQQGSLTQGIGALSSLAGAWAGFEKMGVAKDQLAFNKDVFNKNYAAQQHTVNTKLEDRQMRRNSASPTASIPVDQYMQNNRV